MVVEDSGQVPMNRSVSFRLLVPSNAVGAIIGQKGEFLRKIRNQCKPGAYLRVPDLPSSRERLVLITCDLDDIPVVMQHLARPIFKALVEDPMIPDDHQNEVLMLVNSQQAGRLVGKGGEMLKDIRVDTGCKRFKIYKDRLPYSEERVCEIKGEEDKIAAAMQQALEILARHPLDHEHMHYIPCSDTFGKPVGDWGGYELPPTSRRNSYQPPAPRDMRDRYDAPFIPDREVRSARRPERSPRRGDMGRGYERERSPLRSSGSSTKNIYIDDCYTRHVIGSKGIMIEKIRRKSGAEVQIAKDDTVTNGERKISIIGRPADLDLALRLINEAIAEKIDRDKRGGLPTSTSQPTQPEQRQFERNEMFDKISSAVPFEDIQDNDETPIEKDITIPNSETASVIGQRGSRIKDMRSYTKCEINIENDSKVSGDTRNIAIRGSARAVHRAEFIITNIAKIMR